MTADDTVWLNRQQLALLFGRDVKTIGKHIANALKEELKGVSTVAKFATVQTEGNRTVTRQVEYYDLDVILSRSVGWENWLRDDGGRVGI